MPAHHLPPLLNQNQMGPNTHPHQHHHHQSAVKVMQLFDYEVNTSSKQTPTSKTAKGDATAFVLNNNNRNNSNNNGITRPDSNQGSLAGKSASSGSLRKGSGAVTCISPESAMKQYMQRLSSFEHHEIFSYPNIYFVGQNAKKKMGVVGAPNNCGYDDDQGSRCYLLM